MSFTPSWWAAVADRLTHAPGLPVTSLAMVVRESGTQVAAAACQSGVAWAAPARPSRPAMAVAMKRWREEGMVGSGWETVEGCRTARHARRNVTRHADERSRL